jgi:choice-of-anchor B domain-containing protein
MNSLYKAFYILFTWFVTILAIGGGNVVSGQSLNMVLLGHWDDNLIPAISGAQYNDVIGYAQGGSEYAIIGATTGNYVIDVSVPSVPVVRAILTGSCTSTRWRDHGIYQNYLYTITDVCATGGLQVWDLSPLPAAPVLVYDSQAWFTNAHTLTINPVSGRIYVAGTNIQPNGALVLDILGHPATPNQVASFFFGGYTHDLYQFNDTVIAFIGNNGINSYNLVNLSAAAALDHFAGYPEAGYAHSGVGINNNKTLVWCDETAGKSVKVGSMADIRTITFQALFKSALLAPTYTNSTAHNPVSKGNLLYTSYYEDGVQVWDMSTPTAPVRVGYYDTQGNTIYNGQVGAWGIDVTLPSGKILVSDTQNGLFILSLNTPVPITLQHFQATALQDQVRLNWTTASELNNIAFVVERSVDGQSFEPIQELPGAGTSSSDIDYVTYDNAPLKGVSYYRLKQLDADGNSTRSSIVSVNLSDGPLTMSASPCPAQAGETVKIKFAVQEATSIRFGVHDMVGRELFVESLDLIPGQAELTLPSAQWAAGSYMLRLDASNFHLEQKLLLVK